MKAYSVIKWLNVFNLQESRGEGAAAIVGGARPRDRNVPEKSTTDTNDVVLISGDKKSFPISIDAARGSTTLDDMLKTKKELIFEYR